MIAAPLAVATALALPAVAQNPASLFWTQQAKLVSSDPGPAEFFGRSVAISGDTILVGEPDDGPTSSGAVHVYVYDGASWNHQAKLAGSDRNDARFGQALSLEGDRALIGTNSDSAYVFERRGRSWSEIQRLRPNGVLVLTSVKFGESVALRGGLAFVGAPLDPVSPIDVPGAMYVFRRGAGVWTLLSKVRAAAPASDDWYGAAIAVSGNTCLVGAPFNEDAGYHAGTAYLNEFGSGTWVESRQLFASDGTDFDDFGQHVALSGNTAAVATPKNALTPGAPGSANGEGAVYVFERDLGGSNHWGEAMLLTTQDPNTPQGFGSSIALEGDRLLVGAPSARGDEIGTVEGLAFDPDTSTLYGVETTSDRLVTIHAASGAATPVGPLGFGHVAGLAFDTISDTLYGTDDSSDVLLTIDTTTGAAIPVGLLGFGQVEALAFDPLGGVLYGADAVSDKLIAIDTATGAGTAIGSFGFPSPNQDVDGLAFDPASGTLYGTRAPTTSPNDHRLVTIDTATGAGTVVGSTGMTNVLGLAHAESAGLLGAKGPGNLLVELDSTTGNGTAIGPFSTFEAGVGAVFVFQRDAGGHDAWGQVARISPPNAGAKDYFGTEVVAVSADTLVGGASSDAAGGPNAGAAYVLRLSASAPSYCTAGTSSAGCQALLSGTGSPSASASNGFWIAATGVEGRKDGILFFGSNGRQANAWGNGSSFHCVVPPVKRGGLLSGVGTFGRCDGAFLQDLNALWCATCPKPNVNPGAGTVVQAQLWYRDPQNTSNQTTSLSDALEFPVGP